MVERLFLELTALAVVAELALSCSSPTSCTEEARYGLDVSVIEQATGQPICDATVRAKDGDFEAILDVQNCHYFGVAERPGTYTVEAEKPGFTTQSTQVKVSRDECHVQPRHIELALE